MFLWHVLNCSCTWVCIFKHKMCVRRFLHGLYQDSKMLTKGSNEVYKLYLLFCFSDLLLDVASMSIMTMGNAKVIDEGFNAFWNARAVRYAMFILRHFSQISKLTLHPFKYILSFSAYISEMSHSTLILVNIWPLKYWLMPNPNAY